MVREQGEPHMLHVIFCDSFGSHLDQGRAQQIMKLAARSQEHILDGRHAVATLPCTRVRQQFITHADSSYSQDLLKNMLLQSCLVLLRAASRTSLMGVML